MITRPPVLALLVVVLAVAACDITQEHIDEASERLAAATVATGSPPTAAQIAATVPLERSHIAGSAWRLVLQSDWPHARAVGSFGSNGRIVWHVATAQEQPALHWHVEPGRLALYHEPEPPRPSSSFWWPARTVNADTICLRIADADCYAVMQRVTP